MSIKLKNVTFSYKGTPVLESFSLEVKRGEAVALHGVSGSGKTSIARLILGLETVIGGSVQAPEKIAAVFQEDRLLPTLTVRKNISIVTKENDRSDYLLKRANLEAVADKKVWQLSGGMKRRLSIARALAYGGEIYFLDEPLRELDEETLHTVASLIKEEITGKTAILITHDSFSLEYLSDRIINI